MKILLQMFLTSSLYSTAKFANFQHSVFLLPSLRHEIRKVMNIATCRIINFDFYYELFIMFTSWSSVSLSRFMTYVFNIFCKISATFFFGVLLVTQNTSVYSVTSDFLFGPSSSCALCLQASFSQQSYPFENSIHSLGNKQNNSSVKVRQGEVWDRLWFQDGRGRGGGREKILAWWCSLNNTLHNHKPQSRGK
jgi:hypothetical protein